MFGSLGAFEIILIVFVLLLLFGGKKIPELAKNIAKGIRQFKTAKQDINDQIETEKKEIEEFVNDKKNMK